MNNIEVAIGVIHQAGWVLICQRRKEGTFANLWEFPGGKVEPGEGPEECVVREVAEELGIRVEVTAPFPAIDHAYSGFAVRLRPYLCMPIDGHPRPLASQRLQWVQAERLHEYPFPEANAQLIDQIIIRLSTCEIPSIPRRQSLDFAAVHS